MTLLDFCLAEYPAREPDFWVWTYPLANIFCLYSAGSARLGVRPGGPTYAEREILAAIRQHAPTL